MGVARPLTRATALVGLACCLAACFLGYDSRWGAAKRAQKAAAQEAPPNRLRGTPSGRPGSEASWPTLELRAYVTPRYATEVTDERTQLARMVDNANEILGPTLRIQLQIETIRSWPGAEGGDLGERLEALTELDPGEDVAWVVGFVGRPPTVQMSFDQLAMANMFGKHFVVRAMSDAAEFDAIESGLDELDEGQRRQLYRRRLRHKETSVFLHEIGHALGVPHERDSRSLMSQRYNHESVRFSDTAAQLMRLTLSQRLAPETTSQQLLARQRLRIVNSTASMWVEQELRGWRASVRPAAAQAEAILNRPAQFDEARWNALRPQDRLEVHATLEAQKDGKLAEALGRIVPLSEAHPDTIEIQELRCQLGMGVGGPAPQIDSHCAGFSRLDKTPGE